MFTQVAAVNHSKFVAMKRNAAVILLGNYKNRWRQSGGLRGSKGWHEFFAIFGLSRTMEGHLGVSKHSPGTFEVIIILLVLQQSGESTAEVAGEQMTTGGVLQRYHGAFCPHPHRNEVAEFAPLSSVTTHHASFSDSCDTDSSASSHYSCISLTLRRPQLQQKS